MSLVKGIASVVGLGGIATAIGLGISSSSSPQTPKVPELKKTTVRERLGDDVKGALSFDDNAARSNWNSNFNRYKKESSDDKKFKESNINSWNSLRSKCKEIHDSMDEDGNNVWLFRKWCMAGDWTT